MKFRKHHWKLQRDKNESKETSLSAKTNVRRVGQTICILKGTLPMRLNCVNIK